MELRSPLPDPESYWIDTAPGPDRTDRPLPKEAQVAVLGAGITGLTAAYLLACSGRSVVVVDAGRVAAGVSGHTTAKVSAQHGLIYAKLRKVSTDTAARYGAAQLAALEWIATESAALGVDCELERRDSIVYSTKTGQRSTLQQEARSGSSRRFAGVVRRAHRPAGRDGRRGAILSPSAVPPTQMAAGAGERD